MASIRTTIKKLVTGNKRIHMGTATYVNATTSSTIQTDLRSVECFHIPLQVAYTASAAGLVTITHSDPGGSAGVVGWMAIGY